MLAGKSQRSLNVLDLEIGQLFHDLCCSQPAGEKIQDVTDADSETPDTRTAAALLGIRRDAIGEVGHAFPFRYRLCL